MIDYQEIKRLSIKYQTTENNIIREYLQHLFLSLFYQEEGSEWFLFKGGTALRIAYGSPRFSEDLDFSGIKDGRFYEENLLRVLEKISKEGIRSSINESKKTSGGWLSILEFIVYNQRFEIRNEISYRKKRQEKEDFLVVSELVPAYRIILLKPKILVEEKKQAVLTRQKSRDFFDLFFILRNPQLRHLLVLDSQERDRLIQVLKEGDKSKISQELKPLVPVNFRSIIKDLPARLMQELAD